MQEYEPQVFFVASRKRKFEIIIMFKNNDADDDLYYSGNFDFTDVLYLDDEGNDFSPSSLYNF